MTARAAASSGIDGLRFVITGAAAGIGRATAELAASRGATVMVSDLDADAAAHTAAAITEAGGWAFSTACDVSDPAAVEALMRTAAEQLGGIDVLHCNAGITDAIASPEPTVEGLTVEAWDRIYAINVRGVFHCVQAALPYLRRSPLPAVVNAASIAAGHARPRTLAYASSKAAVTMLTKSLALELAADGIRVNAYSPGMIRTEMAELYLAASDDPAALLSRTLENYLAEDIGEPRDVAEVVCFLASPAARFVNGAVVDVDGGFAAFKATPEERGAGASRTKGVAS